MLRLVLGGVAFGVGRCCVGVGRCCVWCWAVLRLVLGGVAFGVGRCFRWRVWPPYVSVVAVWQLCRGRLSAVDKTFEILYRFYRSKVVLKRYSFKRKESDPVQDLVQIDVHDDQLFYG